MWVPRAQGLSVLCILVHPAPGRVTGAMVNIQHVLAEQMLQCQKDRKTARNAQQESGKGNRSLEASELTVEHLPRVLPIGSKCNSVSFSCSRFLLALKQNPVPAWLSIFTRMVLKFKKQAVTSWGNSRQSSRRHGMCWEHYTVILVVEHQLALRRFSLKMAYIFHRSPLQWFWFLRSASLLSALLMT